jgi:hypothetical protein
METTTSASSCEEFSSAVLPSQFNDLIRRRPSNSGGEYRLLWAVLEDAIRTYLSNVNGAGLRQRDAFDEVREWFFAERQAGDGLFGFHSICDALDIAAPDILLALSKLQIRDLPMRRYNRALRIARVPRIAA